MTTERIAVFDVLGPMYHYDPNGWITTALEPLAGKLQKHGYTGKTAEEEAQDEESLVRSGKEPIHIMPGFAEIALFFRQHRVRPVVVSAGTPWVLEHTLELAAQDYSARTGNYKVREQLVTPSDLVSTVAFGSKKDPETWQKAVQPYDGAKVVAIYEDNMANLIAAIVGLEPTYGFHVVSSKSGLARAGYREHRDEIHHTEIFRGHMEETLKLMQEVLSP